LTAGSRRTAAAWVAVLTATTTAGLVGVVSGDGPGSMLRHLYAVPVAWAALRLGLAGGAGTAALAAMLDAPGLLRAIEVSGLAPAVVEHVITLGLLACAGGVIGGLAGRSTRHFDRYQALLGLQRAMGDATSLEHGLAVAGRALARALRAEQAEVVIDGGAGAWVGARGPRVLAEGTAGHAAAGGRPVHLPDAVPASGRPQRVVAVPLVARGRVIGVAGVRRHAWWSRDDRAALQALGLQVALALENGALASALESKLAAAAARLTELDRAKSELISIASHELRTPLTSLLGFSELLLGRQYDDADRRRFVSMIHGEARRLARLLDNLLDVARVERGQRLPLSPEPIGARALLEAAAALFAEQGSRHRFSVVAEAGLPALLVDRDAVDRVLANLVSNALKYSAPGSEIRLRAERGVAGFVELSVEDDGCGIPADALPHVFDPYYRVASADRTARGLGLGLALVKSLAEAHGGGVRVASAPGVGSRFTVWLPCGVGEPAIP
jgi:signal transduction histidine kinase